jgi:protein-S-isoprenylcysteine O-methyltransferase Ste14
MPLKSLELKIPPPVVALLAAAAMWWVALRTPVLPLPSTIRHAAAIGIAALGCACDLAGLHAFRRARTTINPMRPAATRSLVSSGIYRFTRNPMYVGLLLFLTAWGVWLSSGWALLLVVAFAGYINRFQIVPEEKVLAQLFGPAYDAFKARVRRWL